MALPLPVPAAGGGGGGIISAIGLCLGSCLGHICTRLIFAGEITTTRGAKCLMMWLQIFFVVLLLLVVSPRADFIDNGCQSTNRLSSNLGVCACQNATLEDFLSDHNRSAPEDTMMTVAAITDDGQLALSYTDLLDELNFTAPDLDEFLTQVTSCMSYGLAVRMTFASQVLFGFMAILGFSGCGGSASKFFPVFKFIMIPVVFIVTLFVNNPFFLIVGDINGGLVTAVFSVGQTIIFLDLLISWNDAWVKEAVQRDARGAGGGNCLKGGLLGFSLLFLLMSAGLSVYLFAVYTQYWLVIGGSLAGTVVLLIASIVIEHGNITTGCGMMLWIMWMVWQAIAVEKARTGDSQDAASSTLKAIVCVITLIALLFTSDPPANQAAIQEIEDVTKKRMEKDEKQTELAATGAGTDGKEGEPAKAPEQKVEVVNVINVNMQDKEPEIPSCDFGVQCLVHMALSGYVLSLIIPVFYQGYARNAVVWHWAAVGVSIFLFAFSLIAPSIFSNRDFR